MTDSTTTPADPTRERIEAACEGLAYHEATTRDGTPCFDVSPSGLLAFLERLEGRCGFETNTFVTAIDRSPADPRFEINYQFLSQQHGDRVRVRTSVPEQSPHVPTITSLWPGANYSERECFDMFGIIFDGHPNLERLLMPEGYEHFPLRKEFPHHGIEPDRLYREWERNRPGKDTEGSPS
ncbi:MAG: NADH-quinone oxidoreductase subunit C [bacterium]|nr:NADH-quinone oxidoreductase subunit C [bacterium]